MLCFDDLSSSVLRMPAFPASVAGTAGSLSCAGGPRVESRCYLHETRRLLCCQSLVLANLAGNFLCPLKLWQKSLQISSAS